MNDTRDFRPENDNSTDEMDVNLNKIRHLFDKDEQGLPPEELDKQIIAAAHREAITPISSPRYSTGWWRRLALPMYVSAGFFITVFAYKSLWPSDIFWNKGEGSTRFSIEASTEQEEADDAQKPSSTQKARERLERKKLPDMSPINERPDSYVSDQGSNQSIPIDHKGMNKPSKVDPSEKNNNAYTGNSMVKANYPEKQAWADKIIQQLKNGEFDRAKLEMNDFKKVYPEYPIEEQVKVFIP